MGFQTRIAWIERCVVFAIAVSNRGRIILTQRKILLCFSQKHAKVHPKMCLSALVSFFRLMRKVRLNPQVSINLSFVLYSWRF